MFTKVQDVLDVFSMERRRKIKKVVDRIFEELHCEKIQFETIELMEHKDGIFLREILDKELWEYVALMGMELKDRENFNKVKIFITSKGNTTDIRSCHLDKETIFLLLQIPSKIKKRIKSIEEE